MSKVLVNETSLTGIADAIRGKNGTNDTYKPSEMAAAIINLPSGGSDFEWPTEMQGGSYWNYLGSWDWVVEKMPSIQEVAFSNSLEDAFWGSSLSDLSHLILTFSSNSNISGVSAFQQCTNLIALPKIKFLGNGSFSTLQSMFAKCDKLKEIPEYFFAGVDDEGNWNTTSGLHLLTSAYFGNMFNGCYSLRKLPKLSPDTSNSSGFNTMFQNCYSLDEVILPVSTATFTSNKHSSTFYYLHRAKKIVFNLQDDGTPYAVSWKSQTLDLSYEVGYDSGRQVLGYGFTTETQVTDATTYEALKDNEDYWTQDIAYSRYNHDSAVETINSLPDVTTGGGTNTIKFTGASGSATDGGAINTLTEEEIAVATAKGWTVTLV